MNATPTAPDDPRDDDALAAEFVLGLTAPEEKAALERRQQDDAGFAALVSAWQARLSGLDDSFAAVPPPARVKAGIDAVLFGGRTAARPAGFWRRFAPLAGFAGGVLATLAVLVVVDRLPPRAPEALLAAPIIGTSDLTFLAVYDRESGALRLRKVAGEAPPDTALELWLIAGDAPPQSLGLVEALEDGPVVQSNLAAGIVPGVTLAVSVEPPGGSPTGAPTGPVVAAGPLSEV